MPNRFEFSRRCDWELATNKVTSLYQELKRDGVDIIDLTVSNPTRCGFLYPEDDILKALSHPDNLSYLADSQGLLKARQAVCQMYQEQGIQVNPHNVFLTASTSEAYSYIFRLIANPDEEVLFPSPSYPLFQFLGELNDVQLRYYSLMYRQQWMIDFASLNNQASKDSKAVVLVNPNNPTGSYISASEIDQLNRFCEANGLAIISDEVFFEFTHQSETYQSLGENNNVLTFVLGGLSKTLGLPQMKLGWILLSGPEDTVKEARQKLEVIADTYLSVNAPVQNAFPIWLNHKQALQSQIKQRITANLDFLQQEAKKVKATELLTTQGGWYAVIRVDPCKTEEEWVIKLLSKYHVFVHPGFFYDFDDEPYFIVSLLPPTEVFQEGILRVLSRVEQVNYG